MYFTSKIYNTRFLLFSNQNNIISDSINDYLKARQYGMYFKLNN